MRNKYLRRERVLERDLRMLDDGKAIPAGVAAALEYLESHFAGAISPTSLATRAGMSTVRLRGPSGRP